MRLKEIPASAKHSLYRFVIVCFLSFMGRHKPDLARKTIQLFYLPKVQEKVLILRYVDGIPAKQIPDLICKEERHTRRIREKALDRVVSLVVGGK